MRLVCQQAVYLLTSYSQVNARWLDWVFITKTDEFGNSQPATAYELHCVDASGEVVKEDPILYAFIWIGIWALVGLIPSVILTFTLAVPGGLLVTKLLNKIKSSRSNVTDM